MKWNATLGRPDLAFHWSEVDAEHSCFWGGGPAVGVGREYFVFLPLQYFDKNKRKRRKSDFEEGRLITQFPIIHSCS